MDQLLRSVSIIAMLVFVSIELFFGISYGEWSFKALVGFGAALALFLLTLPPPQKDRRTTTRMKP